MKRPILHRKRHSLHALQDQFDAEARRAAMLALARRLAPQLRADLAILPLLLLGLPVLTALVAAMARALPA